MRKKFDQGLSVIEVVIGAAIILLTVSATALAFQAIVRAAALANHTTTAAFLLEEGVEAVKVMRGGGWNNIANLNAGTAYALVFSGGAWTAQTDRQFIDGLFDRTITVANVYRDNSDDIASSGTLDPDTKQLTVSVAWREHNATTTKTVTTYVTNF
jgi:Tfp pilus assembly protein PilV